MFVAVISVPFKPADVPHAQSLLARALEDTRAFDGCIEVHVAKDETDPGLLHQVEFWASREHFDRYQQFRAGSGRLHDLEALVVGPPATIFADKITDV